MDGKRRIETEAAKENIKEIERIKEEYTKLVNELEARFVEEFADAYDSTKAQELKNDIDAMRKELENINRETETIARISNNYVVSSENVDVEQ